MVLPVPAPIVQRMQPVGPLRPSSTELDAGVTVTGSGEASAPAESARLTIFVNSADNRTDINEAKLQPLVHALAEAGAEPNSIHIGLEAQSPAYVRSTLVTATVAHPTQAMLDRGIQIVGEAVVQMQNVNLSNAQVLLMRSDCTSLYAQATQRAVAQARANAARLAGLVGERLGPVLAVDAQGMQHPCTSYVQMGAYAPSQLEGALTDVHVNAFVRVRYALKR